MRLRIIIVTINQTIQVRINLSEWVTRQAHRIVSSIAFYPALIAMLYLGLSFVMISIDFSDAGKHIKTQIEWLQLKDASTARTVISVIAAGILSLTVFSFTMVMVVLNQAASQMSNRVLDKLIGNRFQQLILGFYIGTIVYSLFLLSAIRNIDSGIYVPSLSTYLLIVFAIVDIFLFIYFLHYITQSVKYVVIIGRIQKQTQKAMSKTCRLKADPALIPLKEGRVLPSHLSGIFEGFNSGTLLRIGKQYDCIFSFVYAPGSFILENSPAMHIYPESTTLVEKVQEEIRASIYINQEESIESNFYYGFRQLTEVAIKALSPGVNDPGTAVQGLRALFQLLSYRISHFPDNALRDEEGCIRIITKEKTFETLFDNCLLPIWDYGKRDRFIQHEMRHLLMQLQLLGKRPVISKLLIRVNEELR
jgi:uncharacterized membrane protein